jgi:hypothetical protein
MNDYTSKVDRSASHLKLKRAETLAPVYKDSVVIVSTVYRSLSKILPSTFITASFTASFTAPV